MTHKHPIEAGNETLTSVASIGVLGVIVGGGRWHLTTLRMVATTALKRAIIKPASRAKNSLGLRLGEMSTRFDCFVAPELAYKFRDS